MGYSARYHATSLIAVFLALAVGILIGAEFGGEVISDTREGLERSLQESLSDSQQEIDELNADLERSQEFGRKVYPALVGDRLSGARIGIVAFGELSESNVQRVEEALEPTGGEIVALGVVRMPPRIDSMAETLEETRFAAIAEEPELAEQMARIAGAQIVFGGGVYQHLRGEIFSRVSGAFGEVDHVVVMRARPADLDEEQAEWADLVERGLMEGLVESGAVVVGVESTDAEESSAGFFDARNVASVDNVDQASGRLSVVLSLLGAQGRFGVKETADSLMPDVITGLGPGVVSLPVEPADVPDRP